MNPGQARKEIVIVQRRLAYYRLPLFELMRSRLDDCGASLRVLYGPDSASDAEKMDAGELSWGEHLPTRYFAQGRLCWQQPFIARVRNADLVVVTQENKILYNYWLLLRRHGPRIAFWGHGRNMQSRSPDGVLERVKRWSTNHVDWWFAYTQMSVDFVVADGFPRDRVTQLNNAVDTRQMIHWRQSIDRDRISACRASLRLGNGPIGITVGSLYQEKRLEFLISAARRVRAEIPTFELLMVGAGPDEMRMREATRDASWIHWLGPKHGEEKVLLLSAADAMLNPGLVGLGILDSFVCAVPMLTTDCGLHSPEIEYLKNGENGIMTENDLESYVGAILAVIRDPAHHSRLREGCRQSAMDYTIEKMADSFVGGIAACLGRNRHVPQ